MEKKDVKGKSYWYFLSWSLLAVIILRIAAFIVSAIVQHQLSIHAQLSENYFTIMQNISAVIISEVRWICYLVMGVWALFWIDNHLTVYQYLGGIVLLWGAQFIVMFAVYKAGASYVTSNISVNNVLIDCIFNSWPRIILAGSIILKVYNLKTKKLKSD